MRVTATHIDLEGDPRIVFGNYVIEKGALVVVNAHESQLVAVQTFGSDLKLITQKNKLQTSASNAKLRTNA